MPEKEKVLTEEKISEEIRQFCQRQKTLILATQSFPGTESSQPLASYAPFVQDDSGNFHLLLSALANHSQNLKSHQGKKSQVSILLIEDEQTSRNLFARKRLNYSCTVSVWPREHPQWQKRVDQLQERFGNTIQVLSNLGDFSLYCLTPIEGHYVRGFGQAYELKDGKSPVLRTQ